jgi:hypothetical protein
MRLGRDHDLLRFAIQNAVIGEFASSSVWVSEVQALAALSRDDEAFALATNATLREDRLHLLAAFANSVWKRTGSLDRELSEQIRSLIDRIEPRSLAKRVHQIAAQLVSPSPDLATLLLDRVRPALPDDEDLDSLFVTLSVRALRDLKDERLRGEVLEKFASKHHDSQTRNALFGFRALASRMNAAEVVRESSRLELPQAKIRLLRAWCVFNAREQDADTVAEHALQLAIRTTSYTLDASLLSDLSLPLVFSKSKELRESLIGYLDGLRGTAERLGRSIDFVKLQLSIATAQVETDRSSAESRLSDLAEYALKIADLTTRGEALARILTLVC